MQADKISPRKQHFQLNLFNAKSFCTFFGKEGIIAHDLHLQALCTLSYNGPNITTTDNTQPLAGNLCSHKFGFFPLASNGRGMCLRDLAGQRQQHGNGMLGCGYRIAKRRVHNHHTGICGGGQINIIHPDTGAAYNFHIVCLC